MASSIFGPSVAPPSLPHSARLSHEGSSLTHHFGLLDPSQCGIASVLGHCVHAVERHEKDLDDSREDKSFTLISSPLDGLSHPNSPHDSQITDPRASLEPSARAHERQKSNSGDEGLSVAEHPVEEEQSNLSELDKQVHEQLRSLTPAQTDQTVVQGHNARSDNLDTDGQSSSERSNDDPRTHSSFQEDPNTLYSHDEEDNLDYCSETQDSFEAIKYDLRPAPRIRPATFGANWLDHDTSGDYDPAAERKRLLTTWYKRKRARMTRGAEKDEPEGRAAGPKKPRTGGNLLSARQAGESFTVTLKLQSAEGKALLAKNSDNWPAGSWNVFSDSEESARHDPSYRLRSRLADPRSAADSIDDEEADLTNHPAARGCKACRVLGQRCPMLEPEGIYPCRLCVEDECECELVVEPKQKRGCEHCKQHRLKCSYLEDKDHSSPCRACQDSGYRCIAGPAIDPTRTRLTLDGKPATLPEDQTRPRRSIHRRSIALDTCSSTVFSSSLALVTWSLL